MGCGKEDLSCLLISEVYETHIVFPARSHRSLFAFGIATAKSGAGGNRSEGHAMACRLQAHLLHSNK